MKKRGSLMIISGPSGAGKGTVIAQLMEQRENLYFSVSFTTRLPRSGETDGVNYHFVDRTQFEHMIAEDAFLEFAEYVGNYYGTSWKLIREHLEEGNDVLLDIDVQGAAKVRSKCPEAITVFLVPPSLEELAARLRGRGTDPETVIQERLQRAREEFKEIKNYDYLVVNDHAAVAAAQISAILTAENCRISNQTAFDERSITDNVALSCYE